MRLNQNMQSLNIYNNYRKTLSSQSSALNKITSGMKINGAKDNPTKLGQSEQMRLQIRSLEMAQKNIQDSTSMLQSIDGNLQTINDTLVRMKELAVKGATDTASEEDKEIIQEEIDILKNHIEVTIRDSNFNGINLIKDGTTKGSGYQVMTGSQVGEVIKIPTYNLNLDKFKDEDGNTLRSISVLDNGNVDIALNVIDESISFVSEIRSKYGSISSRLESTSEHVGKSVYVMQGAESRIRDTDIALEMAEYARTNILTESALALMVQSNNFPQEALRALERMK